MRRFYPALTVCGLMILAIGCDSGDSARQSPLEPTPGFSHVPGLATGQARLHPVNRSGVKGIILFTDDGSTLTIEGRATGLDPAKVYASLIYDNRSVPGGPEACDPAIFDPNDPDFIFDTMFVGIWTVDAQGNGTLSEVDIVDDNTGMRVYVPLDKFRTISIRDLINNGIVVACGQEATHPAG